MNKGKDFYGTEIATVIEQACKELGTSREHLDITVLETGSAGIFGLCKKKAHIRVVLKAEEPKDAYPEARSGTNTDEQQVEEGKTPKAKRRSPRGRKGKPAAPGQNETSLAEEVSAGESLPPNNVSVTDEEPDSPAPAAEATDRIMLSAKEILSQILVYMGLPSTIEVQLDDDTLLCRISGTHEEHIASQDGRVLDSLQYILRKMLDQQLPERMALVLDAAGYREKRTESLKAQALLLAEQVKSTGKTQGIGGLNPSERRTVHLILQQETTVRSRSVGSGLFKKVLIYKLDPQNKSNAATKGKRRGSKVDTETED